MYFRKKGISYIVWTVAMVTIVIMAAQYAFLFGIDYLFAGDNNIFTPIISQSTTYYDIALLSWIVVFILACILIYNVGHGISKLIYRKISIKSTTASVIKVLLTAFLILGAILVRGQHLLVQEAIIMHDTTCFDAAQLNFEQDASFIELSVHGASFAYVNLLVFIMQFLGVRVYSAVFLQVIIQIFTILLLFVAVNRLFGFGTAFLSTGFVSFMPIYLDKIYDANPGCFVGLIFAFALFLISSLMTIKPGAFKVVFGIITGLILGFLVYLEAFILLVLVVWLMCMLYELGDKERRPVLPAYILTFLFWIVGFALGIAIDGGFQPDGIQIAILSWLKVTITNIIPEYALIEPNYGMISVLVNMIMVGLASFSLLGFLNHRYINLELGWLLMMLGAISPLTKLGFLQDNNISIFIYAIVASMGIASMKYVEDEQEDVIALEEVVAPDDSSNIADNIETDTEENISEEDMPGDTLDTYDVSDDVDDGTSAEDVDDDGTSAEDSDLINSEEQDDRRVEDSIEDLPTSISWASIKAADDAIDDFIYGYMDEEESEDSGSLVLEGRDGTCAVIEGLEDLTEEVYEPDDNDLSEGGITDSGEDGFVEDSEASAAEEKTVEESHSTIDEVDRSMVQVDDLPGMIPNPLPLPAKKPHAAINYGSEIEEDDMFFDFDVDDDDDFDI